MCSISGILSASRKDLSDVVERMNSALTHRGPDDQGIARVRTNCGHVALGNTRLAIIDTSRAGHQPMHDPETGNWITYNGETYNFKQLRAEIDRDSHAWLSNTDTEVVLRAYGRWETDAFRRLRGMFALAIWDEAKQQLILARDPLGIKPLYYYRTASLFVFASELRALLASGLVPRTLSSDGVDSYLATGSVEAPLTIVEGVRQLMPGEYLQLSVNSEIQIGSFTHTHHETNGLRSRAEAVARLRSELEESLRLHLVSDVPLGVFLSGGMDSSALVALTRRITGNPPRTFSVVFDEPEYSEAPHARAIAARFNTDHSETRLTEDQLLAMLPDAITALDQPTMDGINTFIVSKAVKNAGVTVALSGLGGDELFGGYPSFRRALQVDAMSSISKHFLRAASGFGRVALNGSTQRQKFWQLAASDWRPEDVYGITRQLFAPQAVKAMTSRNSLRDKNGNAFQQLDTVNTISALELRGYMTNTLLRDTDAMSMAHSLEVRVPLVDAKVVEFALSLPGKWKLNGASIAKPLLADAVADLLPREIMSRPKMGFTLPFEKWLQGCLRDSVTAVLEDAARMPALGLARDPVKSIWRRFLQKPRAIGWSRPWSLYVLARWCEINQVTLS